MSFALSTLPLLMGGGFLEEGCNKYEKGNEEEFPGLASLSVCPFPWVPAKARLSGASLPTREDKEADCLSLETIGAGSLATGHAGSAGEMLRPQLCHWVAVQQSQRGSPMTTLRDLPLGLAGTERALPPASYWCARGSAQAQEAVPPGRLGLRSLGAFFLPLLQPNSWVPKGPGVTAEPRGLNHQLLQGRRGGLEAAGCLCRPSSVLQGSPREQRRGRGRILL